MTTEQIKSFLDQFGNVEISNVNQIVKFTANREKDNLYFLGNVKDNAKRNKDTDIISKNYFFIDIDIRSNFKELYGDIISDDNLDAYVEGLKETIDGIDMYNERSYIVNSGNGVHIYYIGDEIQPNPELWSAGYSYIVEKLDEIIDAKEFATDKANKNIARICRIPGSINFSRQTKYGLEPKEVEIKYSQTKKSQFLNKIYEYGEQYLGNKQTQQAIKELNYKHYEHKGNNIFEAICEIDIRPIVCADYGLQMAKDGRNFIGNKQGYEGMFVVDNVLINEGSHYLNWGTNKAYNTYSYIKYKNGYSDQQTFERFKGKYPHIKDLDKPIKKQDTKITIPETKLFTAQGYLYGNEIFDEFECAMSGELVTIVAETNSGKTTFAMDMITTNSKRGKKGFYINLEFAIDMVWKQKWLYLNKKTKKNLTDIDPLTAQEQKQCDEYVKRNLKKFDYHNNPEGMELEDLIELIINKANEGYSLFVIDTFSKIKGNLDKEKAHTTQNKTMERMQELCQKLGIVVVLLHHTNKNGVFEGSQKIKDLSNVFIIITKEEDPMYGNLTKYSLSKDKLVTMTEIYGKYDGEKMIKAL